jgi:protein gp37
MAGLSDIEWTDATWNPVSGCSMVSPGCTNCYAMRMAARLQAMPHPSYQGVTRNSGGRAVWTGRIRLNPQALLVPLRWRKPRYVFVNSMSDLFHEAIPVTFIQQVWETMQKADWHVFQVLTKRPERMLELCGGGQLPQLRNVWLGTSVEDAERVERIEILGQVPAAIRFVSFEPLLGPVGDVNLTNIAWAIVGGESGPAARPIAIEWVDAIKEACDEAGTAFFFKQWGGKNKKRTGREYRGRTWDEIPAAA